MVSDPPPKKKINFLKKKFFSAANKFFFFFSFTMFNIRHHDLYMQDGADPPEGILKTFLKIAESAPGAIAVHCKVRNENNNNNNTFVSMCHPLLIIIFF